MLGGGDVYITKDKNCKVQVTNVTKASDFSDLLFLCSEELLLHGWILQDQACLTFSYVPPKDENKAEVFTDSLLLFQTKAVPKCLAF